MDSKELEELVLVMANKQEEMQEEIDDLRQKTDKMAKLVLSMGKKMVKNSAVSVPEGKALTLST